MASPPQHRPTVHKYPMHDEQAPLLGPLARVSSSGLSHFVKPGWTGCTPSKAWIGSAPTLSFFRLTRFGGMKIFCSPCMSIILKPTGRGSFWVTIHGLGDRGLAAARRNITDPCNGTHLYSTTNSTSCFPCSPTSATSGARQAPRPGTTSTQQPSQTCYTYAHSRCTTAVRLAGPLPAGSSRSQHAPSPRPGPPPHARRQSLATTTWHRPAGP